MASMWKYKNDIRELHKELSSVTDKKVLAEHTCPRCGDYTFKDEIEVENARRDPEPVDHYRQLPGPWGRQKRRILSSQFQNSRLNTIRPVLVQDWVVTWAYR